MEDTPYFHAVAAFACKANRLYRIYVRRQELVFIWAGKGGEGLGGARAMGRFARRGWAPEAIAFSLAGKGLEKLIDPARGNQSRQRVLDATPLSRLIPDHPANLRAHTAGFEEVRIGKRSDAHARRYSDHGHQGLLHIRHRKFGRLRLGLCSIEDVQAAMDLLPTVLGTRYRVDTSRPLREQPCGCRMCRNWGPV
ncbi:MAG TPA: hypothetical protein VFR91_05385 [Dyella sp.]|nr:hypothetical protein [Dyella sp.]